MLDSNVKQLLNEQVNKEFSTCLPVFGFFEFL